MKKKAAINNDSSREMFAALRELEKTKNIPMNYMLEQIKRSIVIACKNTYDNDDVEFVIDPEKGVFKVYILKTVVEEVTDPKKEVDTKLGRDLDIYAVVGSKVRIAVDTKNLGRIAIGTARSIIRQGIHDGEKDQMFAEIHSKSSEVVTANVDIIDPVTGNASIKIGNFTTTLPKGEQVGISDLKEGGTVKVYILDEKDNEGGKKSRVFVSRTHQNFVKRLFESAVPEIYDGSVEIKSIAREAGSRTKLAVFSTVDGLDAVGSCIGARGARVAAVVEELGGEKIDIVEYSEKPEEFIAAALSPASVVGVEIIDEDAKSCRVTVPDNQLSLAIGNKGQNARLAAKLTGWKVDIRPESGFFGEDEDEEVIAETAEADTETAFAEEEISE